MIVFVFKRTASLSNNSHSEITKNSNRIPDNFNSYNTSLSIESSNCEIDKTYSTLYDNLLIGEIILLNWLDRREINCSPPQYFHFVYGINTNISVPKLSQLSLIRIGKPNEVLNQLKVIELKEILKNITLKYQEEKLN